MSFLLPSFVARRLPATIGLSLSLAGLLLLPAAWSVSASANASLNTTLPQAGPQQGAAGATFGSAAFDDGTPQLAAWLRSHNDPNATWQLVVANSQDSSRLIAQYGISVMSLGGFMGRDDTISVAGFADLVSSGSVRYVLPGQEGALGRFLNNGGRSATLRAFPGLSLSGPNAVMAAIQNACALTADSPSRYQGVLYDCAGKAEAIRQQTY